jgi:hypothetical protein
MKIKKEKKWGNGKSDSEGYAPPFFYTIRHKR